MNERLDLVEDAIAKWHRLKNEFPGLPVLDSVGNQLQFIKAVLTERDVDRSRLTDIIIGVQTAREIETLDLEAAEVFYRVSGLVDALMGEI